MHVFGTVCLAYIQEKKKLDDRAEKGIFVGYDKESSTDLIHYCNLGIVKKFCCVCFTDKFEKDQIEAKCIPILSKNLPCQTDLQTVGEENWGKTGSPTNETVGEEKQGVTRGPTNEP